MRNMFACGAFAAALLCGTIALAADKPVYGAWGLDEAGMDKSTKPGDNFFRYANGTGSTHTKSPPTSRQFLCAWK